MTKYQWKIESLAKGIDPDNAQRELERIEEVYGCLTPENVVKASQAKNAVLHSLFEWHNDVAAHQYRLQQARTLLNNIHVEIITDGLPINVPVYEVVPTDKGKSYKHISSLSISEVEYVRKQTLISLRQMKDKLKMYNQFEKIVDGIINLIKELETV